MAALAGRAFAANCSIQGNRFSPHSVEQGGSFIIKKPCPVSWPHASQAPRRAVFFPHVRAAKDDKKNSKKQAAVKEKEKDKDKDKNKDKDTKEVVEVKRRRVDSEAAKLKRAESLRIDTHADEPACDERYPRWEDVKHRLKPTQAALGWDWAFKKLTSFSSAEGAQAYMDKKPIPVIQRGDNLYVLDHHHTLAALEMSDFNPRITLDVMLKFAEGERSEEVFWGFLEGKGWAYLRDENYNRLDPQTLPKSWCISAFRNDVYRSMGGFARQYKILARGEKLEDKLFFEFKWGYFIWLHRDDEFGLWPDERIYRGWKRLKEMVEALDMQEYMVMSAQDEAPVEDIIYLSVRVIQPPYKLLCLYLHQLLTAYSRLQGQQRVVPGISRIFGALDSELPGTVIPISEDAEFGTWLD